MKWHITAYRMKSKIHSQAFQTLCTLVPAYLLSCLSQLPLPTLHPSYTAFTTCPANSGFCALSAQPSLLSQNAVVLSSLIKLSTV